MTAQEFRDALAALGLTQAGAGRFLGVDPRTVRRWCAAPGPEAREVPEPVARWFSYMIAAGVTPEEVMRVLAATSTSAPE